MSKIGYHLHAKLLEKELQTHIPAHAEKAFEDLLAGRDCEAVIYSFPNDLRGLVMYLVYVRLRAGLCSIQLFRDVLSDAWNHDHDVVIQSIGNRSRLRAMFRRADFPVPKDLPEHLDIWRGVSGVPLARAKRGISWTTNRDVACWFAMRHQWGEPILLKARVSKTAVLHLPNDRCENEVICFDDPAAEIDGDPEQWREGYKRWEDTKNAENRKYLASVKQGYAAVGRHDLET